MYNLAKFVAKLTAECADVPSFLSQNNEFRPNNLLTQKAMADLDSEDEEKKEEIKSQDDDDDWYTVSGKERGRSW